MKTHSILLLLACLGFMSAVSSQNTYCGRRLAVALDYVCEGHLIKRSEPEAAAFELSWPWIEPARAYTMGFRSKRQVVAECCDKPCTVDELMTYCGV
ncbi:bombyxin A-3 homolog [Bicyclus anynana]|uniref:Bombyxin A-3 homolog n=1 Tax=Bicyclus anynana TaxID=110368 RepID=A0A6J1MPK8_BICAN|nr:bombyxin A-3 homolog [Bicyclus anynana]